MSRDTEWIRAERRTEDGEEQVSYGSTGIVLRRTRVPDEEWSAWRAFGTYAQWRPLKEHRQTLERAGWTILEPEVAK